MRLRSTHSPLLLLLIPSLATGAALGSSSSDLVSERDASSPAAFPPVESPAPAAAAAAAAAKPKYATTKDAPVDGKDGRPHQGPFVEIENLRKADSVGSKELQELQDYAEDTLVVDGKAIPESNDGVMDDKNRPEPKEGTTGTSGGVTEKDKARKAEEGRTGEKAEKKPETPKEAPPLPHSEQEKIAGDKDAKAKDAKAKDAKDKDKPKEKSKTDAQTPENVAGLEKPADLPDRTHAKAPPLPNSANKDHLDVSQGSRTTGGTLNKIWDEAVPEGFIQPFHSFVLSLTMILFSEVGDKTFLIAALMAMKHDRLVVFSAAFSALITMTVLSAVLGHAVPALIPKQITNFLASALFLFFGARLLREGLAMKRSEGVAAEMQEVELELEQKAAARKHGHGRRRSSISPYGLEMGLGGDGSGNGTGISNGSSRKARSDGRFPTPPRSPSASPSREPTAALGGFLAGLGNLVSLLLSPAWVQTFVMTFLGEWGDRSQIATIAMAAGQDYWWVTLGAVLGHGCCTSVAVLGGRAIAGRVSLKVVTMGGAIAFLAFGVIYLFEGFYA